MYLTVLDRIVPGADFAELCMLSAQRRQFSDGLTPEEFVDRRLSLLRNPRESFEQILSNGRVTVVNERRTVHAGTVSLTTDITGYRHYESLLRERLAAIEASADGIAICDWEGRFTYLNEAAVALFGYSRRGELLWRCFTVLFEQDSLEMLEKVAIVSMRERNHLCGEARALDWAGRGFDLELSLTAAGKQGCICVRRDISHASWPSASGSSFSRSSIRRKRWRQSAGWRAGGGGAAHDFNNIPASNLGYTALLLEDLPGTPVSLISRGRSIKGVNARASSCSKSSISAGRRSAATS